MRGPRDVAASSNQEAAQRLVRSLVGVVDVAFRYARDGRVDSVFVLPATGAHERQVRLNVASGLMAGFGIALDPAKVELVRNSDELRAIEAAAPFGNAAAGEAHAPSQYGGPAGAPAKPRVQASNSVHPGHANGASPDGNGGASPPRPVLRPRAAEGVGLAARAFHALDERNMQPVGPPTPARVEPTPPAPPVVEPDPWDEPHAGSPFEPTGPRRVRLLEDATADAARDARDPVIRPFPAPAPAQPEPHGAPAIAASAAVQGSTRPSGYLAQTRGGAAAALALPLEPPPAPAARPHPAGMPKLEVAEVVAARGVTFCRVIIEVDHERFTAVTEVAEHELDRQSGTLQLVARVTADALRSARVPREPTQFLGAAALDVAGKPFVVAVLRCWNGRSFDDLSAVEAINDSPEEAAALAVLRAAASRNA